MACKQNSCSFNQANQPLDTLGVQLECGVAAERGVSLRSMVFLLTHGSCGLHATHFPNSSSTQPTVRNSGSCRLSSLIFHNLRRTPKNELYKMGFFCLIDTNSGCIRP
jgi:hypothetical protein